MNNLNAFERNIALILYKNNIQLCEMKGYITNLGKALILYKNNIQRNFLLYTKYFTTKMAINTLKFSNH